MSRKHDAVGDKRKEISTYFEASRPIFGQNEIGIKWAKLVYIPEGKMAGGLRLAMYFNSVLNLVKYVAMRLLSVCLHGVVLDELRVRNGILKIGGMQHGTMDTWTRLDTGFGAETYY